MQLTPVVLYTRPTLHSVQAVSFWLVMLPLVHRVHVLPLGLTQPSPRETLQVKQADALALRSVPAPQKLHAVAPVIATARGSASHR